MYVKVVCGFVVPLWRVVFAFKCGILPRQFVAIGPWTLTRANDWRGGVTGETFEKKKQESIACSTEETGFSPKGREEASAVTSSESFMDLLFGEMSSAFPVVLDLD